MAQPVTAGSAGPGGPAGPANPGWLVLDDERSYADLATFVARARSLDGAGAIRLQASGTVLATYVGVLPGRGLLGDGTVVGLRVIPLAEAATVDVTVALADLSDRLARAPADGPGGVGVVLPLPPAATSTSWAGMTPPRSGWEPVGTLDGSTLLQVARDGIAEVAEVAGGTTSTAGAPALADLRHRVWGRLTETDPPVVAGAAFAAYALGFIAPDAPATLAAHGRWTRLSSARGHVLVR